MKKKKKWRKIFLILTLLLIGLLIYGGSFIVRNYINTKKLENLNYEESAIKVIKEKELEEYIIENKLYSEILNQAFKENIFNIDYIDSYVDLEYKEDFNNANAINSLYEKKYSVKEITNIFKYLEQDEISTILDRSYEENLISMIENEYFIMDNIDRYKDYKKETDYETETVISYVNIGLDNKFYTNIKNVEDPDNLLVICNKYNKLPSDYVPTDLEKINSKYSTGTKELRKPARMAFEEMATDIEALGMHIEAYSAYRSYEYQSALYQRYVARDGKESADKYSARPAHSEHQTGLAVDVHDGTFGTFGYTDEYEWVKDNAHKYGFIIRYTKENEHITGYMSEPWHLRYLGIEVATYVYENNITFDEYYVKFIEKK